MIWSNRIYGFWSNRTFGCKDIGIKKSEFATKTDFDNDKHGKYKHGIINITAQKKCI